jgi:hypothetical protein
VLLGIIALAAWIEVFAGERPHHRARGGQSRIRGMLQICRAGLAELAPVRPAKQKYSPLDSMLSRFPHSRYSFGRPPSTSNENRHTPASAGPAGSAYLTAAQTPSSSEGARGWLVETLAFSRKAQVRRLRALLRFVASSGWVAAARGGFPRSGARSRGPTAVQ